MAKIKPLVMSFKSVDELEKMKAEYDFIGRDTDVNVSELKLTVLTLPRKYKKKQSRDNKPSRNRSDNDSEYGDSEY